MADLPVQLRTRLTALAEAIADLWWAAYYLVYDLRARASFGRRWWLLRRRLRGPGQQSTISVFRNGDFERLAFGALIDIDKGRPSESVRVVGVELAGDCVTLTVEAA